MFPDWMLERFLLGELDPATSSRLEAALATTPALQDRLEALKADTARTLAQHPPELVARVVARRLAARPPRPSPLRFALPALAAAAAVAFLVFAPASVEPQDEVRLKGSGPVLRLYRLSDAGPERLDDAAPVREHDVVQVSFELADWTHLVVLSIDGSGNATLHFPLDGRTAVPPGMKALQQSFELDDAPAFERFFLVASQQPLSPQALLDSGRRLGRQPDAATAPLVVPDGAVVRTLRLDKVSP